ncbi:MAG TPA: sigma-70 family RNA polymerase sigma factor [Gaiellaceae bacterium]|jgi:RNA polymerase sigma factor (sigma-70 family)|nr:sigma-70 family RNA polymerase sigma factor [Gaiellaceae bacterium]
MAAIPETTRATDLYERYASRIFGYCLHRLGSREEAEDAVQTTFLNAFRSLSRGVVPESESAWLFKIAENVCLSRHRASFRRRRVEAPADLRAVEETVAAPARPDEELIPLEGALADMPETQRRALLLREWQGLSYREIAAELEVSQSAVETLIFRARRSLARRLEAPRERLRRVGQAVDVGAALAALKGAFTTGAAAKAALAGVAVTGLAVGVALDRPQPRRHDAPPAPVAPVKGTPAPLVSEEADAPVVRAPRIVAPEPRRKPSAKPAPHRRPPASAPAAASHRPSKARPKSHPRAAVSSAAAAPSPPPASPAAPQRKPHEQQASPHGRSAPKPPSPAAKSDHSKPKPPEPKADEQEPSQPQDAGEQGDRDKAKGKERER